MVATYFRYGKLVRRHWRIFRRLPNIFFPRDYNDKMFWRKVFDRNPLFVTFADKLAAKDYARARVPDLQLAELLWVGSCLKDAPAALFDQDAILKINNSNGRYLLLPDRSMSRDDMIAISEAWKTQQHGKKSGEWSYALVPPALLIERRIACAPNTDLTDIRVFVAGGKVLLIVVDKGVLDDPRYALFDAEGVRLAAQSYGLKDGQPLPTLPPDFRFPVDAGALGDMARAIADGIDHVRVDFMWNGLDLYFAEVTVFPRAGYINLSDPVLAQALADNWDLRQSWFLQTPQSGWRAGYAGLLRQTLEGTKPRAA